MSRTHHRRPPRGRLSRLRGCWCGFCRFWHLCGRRQRDRERERLARREFVIASQGESP